MNEFIKKELQKVKVAQLPAYDDETLEIYIPRLSRPTVNVLELTLGRTYIVELAEYILNEPAGFTLHANWNNNIKPTTRFMQATVIQVIGNMIKLHCNGYDIMRNEFLPNEWEGWCPRKGVKVIREVFI